jgi:hypothetical protein
MTNQYLVLHMSDQAGAELSREDDQRMLHQWADEGSSAGRLHGGGPVAEPEAARSVAVRDGRVLITDGPFPEFKEWFAGYDLITADTIEEATAYMAGHPLATRGRIYILPMVKLPWDND